MIDLPFILLSIIILFGLFVGLRSLFDFKICALCGAVFINWFVLLVLFYLGNYIDPVLLGILMGGSVVGFIYLLEAKLPEHFQIFKLPFFLTLVSVTYFVLNRSFEFKIALLLILLWIFMIGIYAGRNNIHFKTLGRKIIECCKNW